MSIHLGLSLYTLSKQDRQTIHFGFPLYVYNQDKTGSQTLEFTIVHAFKVGQTVIHFVLQLYAQSGQDSQPYTLVYNRTRTRGKTAIHTLKVSSARPRKVYSKRNIKRMKARTATTTHHRHANYIMPSQRRLEVDMKLFVFSLLKRAFECHVSHIVEARSNQ